MIRRLIIVVSLVGQLAYAELAGAHHSIAANYDFAERITIKATVLDFLFVNPHPFLIVEVIGADGARQEWKLEMDNRWELAQLGFGDSTLQPGNEIVVTGSVGRNEARALYVRRLERPSDGFVYQHHR